MEKKPVGFQFYCKFPNVCVYHSGNKHVIADNFDVEITDYEKLSDWVDEYIGHSDENHFSYLAEIIKR